MKLLIKKINSEAFVPSYGSIDAAGLDLYSCVNYVCKPGTRECVSTGISIEWTKNNEYDENPKDFYLRIAPRSGLAYKNGIDILAGVIDYDYRGEIKIIIFNSSDKEFVINKGDRIAQAILTRIIRFNEINIVDALSDTQRGVDGFGSTGTR